MSGDSQRGQAITAGFITAIVGFLGAFPIVLAGSRAAGATEAQAASGQPLGLLVSEISCGGYRALAHRATSSRVDLP